MRSARLLAGARPSARLTLAARRFAASAHHHEEVDPLVEVLAKRAQPLNAAEFRTMVDIAFEGKWQHERVALAGQLAKQLQDTHSSPELVESAKALSAELSEAAAKERAATQEQAERVSKQVREFIAGEIAWAESLPGGKYILTGTKLAVAIVAGLIALDWVFNDFGYWVYRVNQKIQWRYGGRPMPAYLDPRFLVGLHPAPFLPFAFAFCSKEERRLYKTMSPAQWRNYKWQQALEANPKAKELYESIEKQARELQEQDREDQEKAALPWKEWTELLEENPALLKAWKEHNLPTWEDVRSGDNKFVAKPQPYW